ncbi:MAG: RNA polymerase sigma factor [Alphaproteobacteria bacterium]|nr:RNA polymerase sigma factor [Alphaproteobacteria bacterium]MCB9791093.1 RNA polymerase sigma factor [Alphaproteobacteria bacterium]
MTPETTPQALVRRACAGDAEALDAVLRSIKDDVYGLALRMLGTPPDAEDATQEILTRVATHLGEFRGEAALSTWVWRIAVRHLGRTRRSAREQMVSFDVVAAMIHEGDGRAIPPVETAEDRLRAEEVKIGCTGAMLLSLDRDLRVAWALAEVFELSGDDAAAVLGISPAAFRKRLQRAREKLGGFLSAHCGLANPRRACRCPRQLETNLAHGTIDLDNLLFAVHPAHAPPRRAARQRLAEVDAIERAAQVLLSHPDYVAPERLIPAVRAIVTDRAWQMFSDEGAP